jgi:hypothetical protein
VMRRAFAWVGRFFGRGRPTAHRGTLTMSAVIHRADGSVEDLGKLAEAPVWTEPGTGESKEDE